VVAEQYRSGAAQIALACAGVRAAIADPTMATLARQVQDLHYQRRAARIQWLAEYRQSADEWDPAGLARVHHDMRAYEDALGAAMLRLRAAWPAYDTLVAPEPLDWPPSRHCLGRTRPW
jgi:hypothetical protein